MVTSGRREQRIQRNVHAANAVLTEAERMWNERECHRLLKDSARHILEEMGIEDIREEYRQKHPRRLYKDSAVPGHDIVDVAGFGEHKNVAIECGDIYCPWDKFKRLMLHFDLVIWLPYLPITGLNSLRTGYKKWKSKEMRHEQEWIYDYDDYEDSNKKQTDLFSFIK